MIQIFTDILTDKITGYNTILPDNVTDLTLVGDDMLPILESLQFHDSLYYIDGKIIEKPEEDGKTPEEVEEGCSTLQKKTSDEALAFLDSILSGTSIEDALCAAKENREKLQRLKAQAESKNQERKEREELAALQKYEAEESRLSYKYFLSMLTVVRDENDYLEEWIRYHIETLGFDHFYIYDNESSTSVKAYLEQKNFPYLDRLTITEWDTTDSTQQDTHRDFLTNFKNESKWIFPADPDEYILFKSPASSLKEFLRQNSQYASIELPIHWFHANGHILKSNEPDMERFTKEVNWEKQVNYGKKFAQTNRIKDFAYFSPIARPHSKAAGPKDAFVTDVLQLNHYYTRSYEEWIHKMERGSSVPGFGRRYSDFFKLNPDLASLNTGEDTKQSYGPAKKRNAPA